jgi:hypothetical protein
VAIDMVEEWGNVEELECIDKNALDDILLPPPVWFFFQRNVRVVKHVTLVLH